MPSNIFIQIQKEYMMIKLEVDKMDRRTNVIVMLKDHILIGYAGETHVDVLVRHMDIINEEDTEDAESCWFASVYNCDIYWMADHIDKNQLVSVIQEHIRSGNNLLMEMSHYLSYDEGTRIIDLDINHINMS